jgi:hypothetical protein
MNFNRNAQDRRQSGPPAASEHEPHRVLVSAVDPSYWPRSLALRVVIAIAYFVLIPAGLLPMSTAWWLVSGGSLLVYSIASLAYYLWHPDREWFHKTVAPYIDTIIITGATIALARPTYPIGIGYLLVVMSLSAVQSRRYVVLFSLWAVAAYWCGVTILDITGRADASFQIAIVVSIMLIFTAINSDVISTSNHRLQNMVLEASLTDPLTGLANRRHFREILDSHATPQARPLAVLMYDIDNFKQLKKSAVTSMRTPCSSASARSCAPPCAARMSWRGTAATSSSYWRTWMALRTHRCWANAAWRTFSLPRARASASISPSTHWPPPTSTTPSAPPTTPWVTPSAPARRAP